MPDDPRLTSTDQHIQRTPLVLALWLAARELEIKQGTTESQKFEEWENNV